jgi:hypothetical protein
MNNPIALALLINHEYFTPSVQDRDWPRRVAPVHRAPSLVARIAARLGRRHAQSAGAAA